MSHIKTYDSREKTEQNINIHNIYHESAVYTRYLAINWRYQHFLSMAQFDSAEKQCFQLKPQEMLCSRELSIATIAGAERA